MRHAVLVLSVALLVRTTEARADQIVTYNMTGTITDTAAYIYSLGKDGWGHTQNYSHPFAAGDHISWTLEYDRSTPPSYPTTPGSYAKYEMQPNTLLFTKIVDQTTGYHFSLLPNSDTGSTLTLSRYNSSPGDPRFSFEANQGSWRGGEFSSGSATQSVWLQLNTGSALPAESLANLQLNKIPFALGLREGTFGSYLEFGTDKWGYDHTVDISNFAANVDSITVSVASTPEPGSLTLFLLGATGLAARSLRRRFRLD